MNSTSSADFYRIPKIQYEILHCQGNAMDIFLYSWTHILVSPPH